MSSNPSEDRYVRIFFSLSFVEPFLLRRILTKTFPTTRSFTVILRNLLNPVSV